MYLKAENNLINKKEYLGRTDITQIIVPSKVLNIENWAFAQCTNLREIAIPITLDIMGKDVFLDCNRLEYIFFYGAKLVDEEKFFDNVKEQDRFLARMTSIAFLKFDEVELRDIKSVGTREWIGKWDKTCLEYINQPHGLKFSPFLAGGEEDYIDKENNYEYYCHMKRLEKVGVILTRLLSADVFTLNKDIEDKYISFLKGLMPDGESVQALVEAGDMANEFYKLYDRYEIINGDNIDIVLSATPEECVELKALLLRKKSECTKDDNVWDAFSL